MSLVASIYDIRNIFRIFDPPVTVTNQLILFLSSAFWGTPSPHALRTSYMEAPFSLYSIPHPPHPHPGVDQEHGSRLVDVVVDDRHAEADQDGLGVVEPRMRLLVVSVGPVQEMLAEELAERLFSLRLEVHGREGWRAIFNMQFDMLIVNVA